MLLNKYKKIFIVKIALILISIILFFSLSFFTASEQDSNFDNNMIFILDTSHSMNVKDVSGKYDVPISRLDYAKLFIKKQLQDNKGYKFGLIIFAGNSNFYIPPTLDQKTFETYLDSLNTGLVPQGGSNIYDGLQKFFSLGGNNVGVLISDMGGMDDFIGQQDNLKKLAQTKSSSRLYIIGVGTTQGGTVKYPNGENLLVENHTVSSSLNQQMGKFLSQIFDTEFLQMDKISQISDFSPTKSGMKIQMDQKTQIIIQTLAVLLCILCL